MIEEKQHFYIGTNPRYVAQAVSKVDITPKTYVKWHTLLLQTLMCIE